MTLVFQGELTYYVFQMSYKSAIEREVLIVSYSDHSLPVMNL